MSKFPGIICKGCKMDDRLYEDSHGIFCSRCGPSVPIRGSIVWYSGLTVDKEGTITHYQRKDGRLQPCPNTASSPQ